MSRRRYLIAGALWGGAFSLLSGAILPLIFVACSTDSAFQGPLFRTIAIVIAAVYVAHCVPLGAWIGAQVWQRAQADPEFRFWPVVRDLVFGFLAQNSYRMMLVISMLLLVFGSLRFAYLRWTGTAACLETRVVDGRAECLRYSLFMAR